MIFCRENRKELGGEKNSWNKRLYSKVARYKVNVQKPIAFLLPAMNNWNLKIKHITIYFSTQKK